MSDLAITAASVAAGAGASVVDGTANAAIVHGKSVYLDPDTGKFGLYDANGATAAIRTLFGVALSASAGDGQPIRVQKGGEINLGATLAVGTVYVGSATPGGIAPIDDLVAGWYTSTLGIAVSTSRLAMQIQNGGVAVPA
jgi:hypothetical protein